MREGKLTLHGLAGTAKLRIWIPEGREEQQNGLQGFEKKLNAGRGMLFVPAMMAPEDREDHGIISMWLASVSVPLAIVWFNAEKVVSHVEVMWPGDYRGIVEEGIAVLEIRAELAAALDLVPGVACAEW